MKRSAGMFEANRKCRLQYDVIKDMSAHFFASPKFFLIKYPIKKIHLILNGFKITTICSKWYYTISISI